MHAIIRQQVPTSTQLLMRILERPGLVAAVRELPGAVLGKLIDRIGLEDAGDIVALATTEQLERVFDDDLWRATRAGGDETFRPERFALWLRVMLEAGEEALVRRLIELPPELVALAVHRLVLVVDLDILEEMVRPGDEEAQAIERAMENAAFEEWEEFRVIAREPDAWDDVWIALLALDREHHDRLREILETCSEMTLEYISGQGSLYDVLTADEMLASDVGAARDDRRVAEGFISPADARAFLELARRGVGGEGGAARDPITRAYFRALGTPPAPAKASPNVDTSRTGGTQLAAANDVSELAALLRAADVVAPATAAQPLAALTSRAGAEVVDRDSAEDGAHVVAPLFEQAMRTLRQRDPARFDARVREVGYLVNVWIAGGAHDGRRPRPAEAMDVVLKACEAGLRATVGAGEVTAEGAVAALGETPADLLFRRGWTRAGA